MTLTLYYHPFASFCQKVLIALYENDTPFEPRLINLGDPSSRAELERVWPLAKFPVLRDEARGLTIPESTVIITYLARHHPGPTRLVPEDEGLWLRSQILDRFFDDYLAVSVTKVVVDTFRPEGGADPVGVGEAKALIARAYDILDSELPEGGWAAGEAFTLADCAAAPALFYANTIVPFGARPRLSAYYRRLEQRPSFARVVEEARPYRDLFPLPWPDDY